MICKETAENLAIAVLKRAALDYKEEKDPQKKESLDKLMRQDNIWYGIIGTDPSIWSYITSHLDEFTKENNNEI